MYMYGTGVTTPVLYSWIEYHTTLLITSGVTARPVTFPHGRRPCEFGGVLRHPPPIFVGTLQKISINFVQFAYRQIADNVV